MTDNTKRLLWVVILGAVAVIAVATKSAQIIQNPFFLNGDPYFHAAVTNTIVETGRVPTTFMHAVPTYLIFYPLGTHLFQAALQLVGGVNTLELNRWLGPLLAAILALGAAVLAKQLGATRLGMFGAALLAAFMPVFVTRFAITVPENTVLLVLLLSLFFLLRSAGTKSSLDLVWAGGLLGASFLLHFGSYLLLPVFGLALLIYGVWIIRTRKQLGLIRFLAVVVSVVALIGIAYPKILATAFSFVVTTLRYGDGALSPPPDLPDWQSHIGYVLVLLALCGFSWVAVKRPLAGSLIGLFLFTILAFLQIFPSLEIFYFLPFRGFAYLGLVIAPLVGVALSRLKWPIVSTIILAAAIATLPLQPSGWDTDLTPAEYEAIRWMDQELTRDSLIVTQPANGRQIIYLTRRETVFDGAHPIFYSDLPYKSLRRLRLFGEYKQYYIFVSDFKRGPKYNIGWNRGWAFPDANYEQFDKREFYELVYRNDDVSIYRALVSPKNS